MIIYKNYKIYKKTCAIYTSLFTHKPLTFQKVLFFKNNVSNQNFKLKTLAKHHSVLFTTFFDKFTYVGCSYGSLVFLIIFSPCESIFIRKSLNFWKMQRKDWGRWNKEFSWIYKGRCWASFVFHNFLFWSGWYEWDWSTFVFRFICIIFSPKLNIVKPLLQSINLN